MTTHIKYLGGPIQRIVFPTDFSNASDVAFIYALKLAIMGGAELNILHDFDTDEGVSWHEFPKVRPLLEQWGLIEKDAPREDVAKLGIRLSKIAGETGNPSKFILNFIKSHPIDLIVMSHHSLSQGGILHHSIAEPIARDSEELALFIPEDCDGFIRRKTGEVSLNTILIPVDSKPDAQQATNAAMRAALLLKQTDVHFRFLHIEHGGSFGEDDFPQLMPFDGMAGWQSENQTLQGDPVDMILSTAAEINADLIVMATSGHQGFLDALRGSVTERVLRESNIPLLAVPDRVIIA